MGKSLKMLIGKLNSTTREALEGAAGLCVSRTNYEIEVEHWLVKLLEESDCDLHHLCHAFEVEVGNLTRDLNRAMDRFRTGNSRRPVLSKTLVDLVEAAWNIASLEHGAQEIRSAHLLEAALGDQPFARLVQNSSPAFESFSQESLQQDLGRLTRGSPESGETSPGAEATPKASGQAQDALDRYTIDLTQQAREGKIDPIVGRDAEIRQAIDVLMRRRQNNPILTGEPGVGKTAVVEGLACQIVAGEVPPPLQSVAIRTLDLGLLQAGAGVKGEFENRLKSVIKEVKASPTPIILFIDEAHTLIGAGGAQGQGDAANLLKPALARGELRTIAATTWAEYKKYFERDAALARRFQVVKVEEPSEAVAVVMMRAVATRLEAHHGVRIQSAAVEDAVHLSARYLSERKLPDKAVSVLDTACARVAVSQVAIPAAVEDRQRRIQSLDVELVALRREHREGVDHSARISDLEDARGECQTELEALSQRWAQERGLVAELSELQARLGQGADEEEDPPEMQALRERRLTVETELRAIQRDDPLMHPFVGSAAVGSVISAWTGIPVGKMVRDELTALQTLGETLAERVIGQAHALETIARRIQVAKAGLYDPAKPIGVFLLVGPSGVGKTETALSLAHTLYGGEHNTITINMSEYQEAHTTSSLKGSPPGYVGYGEGGVLTEAVRRKPYSVVLLDEIEKAHPDVMELFYQVFDKGMMEDGEGREINFRNTVFLLTSNLGTEEVMEACLPEEEAWPTPAELTELLRPSLLRRLKPALLGRMNVIPYYPLGDAALTGIARLKLDKVSRRVAEAHKAELIFDDSVVSSIVSRCTEVDSGARNIDHIVSERLLPELSRELLSALSEGRALESITVSTGGEGFQYTLTEQL